MWGPRGGMEKRAERDKDMLIVGATRFNLEIHSGHAYDGHLSVMDQLTMIPSSNRLPLFPPGADDDKFDQWSQALSTTIPSHKVALSARDAVYVRQLGTFLLLVDLRPRHTQHTQMIVVE